MSTILKKLTPFFTILFLMNCGGHEAKKKEGFIYENETAVQKTLKQEVPEPPSKQIHLDKKGVGPVTSITLDEKIDTKMASKGEALFKKLCAACHRPDKKFIGPAPKNILERRSPEWVMNIILNPIEMIKKEELAKALQNEFDGAIMPVQNVKENDARALIEYFRTL